MKRKLVGVVAITGVALSAVFLGRSLTAHGQGELAVIDDARLVYIDRVATNDAPAERWKAAHRDADIAGPSDDELAAAANHGCPSGTQFWQRDRITEVCAPHCTSDADCAPEDGRCRVLDVEDRSNAPEIVLVDDLSEEEVAAWLAGDEAVAPPVLVCDPFWDVPGALDADLVAAAVVE